MRDASINLIANGLSRLRILLLLAIFLIAACSGDSTPAPSAEAQLADTPASVATVTRTASAPATPTIEPVGNQATGPAELTIWWPDTLRPVDNTAIEILLDTQIEEFESARGDVVVNSRLKRVGVVGGIIATLRAAAPVAPGALPDVTLLPREGLLTAVQDGLIQPLEGQMSSAILGDLFAPVLALGQVDGQLYGMPYALNVQHIVYPVDLSYTSSRFSSLLTNEIPLILPVLNNNGASEIFLSQYLAALASLDDVQTIDAPALRSTLNFYDNAVATGLVDPIVLEYAQPNDYSDLLLAEAHAAAAVTPAIYFDLIATGQSWETAPLPSASGQAMTPLDGWMWVIVTPDVERQALALDFVMWMLDGERQSQYNLSIGLVPSQRSALRRWGDDAAYSDFIGELLQNAIIIPSPIRAGASARAMQNALTAVIGGATSAEEAAQSVIDLLAN